MCLCVCTCVHVHTYVCVCVVYVPYVFIVHLYMRVCTVCCILIYLSHHCIDLYRQSKVHACPIIRGHIIQIQLHAEGPKLHRFQRLTVCRGCNRDRAISNHTLGQVKLWYNIILTVRLSQTLVHCHFYFHLHHPSMLYFMHITSVWLIGNSIARCLSSS